MAKGNHGRLIDADELKSRINPEIMIADKLFLMINNAKTIIESTNKEGE